jgi:hypothetical protein
MVRRMPGPTPSPVSPNNKETRAPGSFLGYQYPEWLFILLVMVLPLVVTWIRFAFFKHSRSAIAMLGWMLLIMAAGFVLWLAVMLILFKLYERKEKRQRSHS